MSESVVGMGKINNRVGLFGSRGPVLHVWRWCGGKESQQFIFNQGPASLKIFIHYFSLSASKIYIGIEELTSNTAVKINPLLLRCTLFDEKQPRIQACFTSIDNLKKRSKKIIQMRFLKQLDITSYSQNHNNLVVLPGLNILHLFFILKRLQTGSSVWRSSTASWHLWLGRTARPDWFQTCPPDSSLDKTCQRSNTFRAEKLNESISVPLQNSF